MRVALLSHNARQHDAIGNQVAAKLAFFRERGAEVRVFLEDSSRSHPAVQSHAEVVNPAQPGPAILEYLSTADLVVAEYGRFFGLLNLLPVLAGGRSRILLDYYGVTPPELWPGPQQELLQEAQEQRGLAWCADTVLVHSRFTLRELAEATGFPVPHIRQVPLPIDPDEFCPAPPRRSLAQQLGIEPAKVLLFVGRVAPNKGLPVLVEALARLRRRQPAIHAAILGDARDVYAVEADRCRELAEQRGVADRLHFLGQTDQAKLAESYRGADLLVLPSRHEGFGLPVLEALASGLPVVVARAAALPETLGDAGLSFNPDDPDDLARQITRVLDSEVVRLPLAARRRIAVVSFRFGTDFPGGAETSLRTIAGALKQQGYAVEVFATCTRSESTWTNELPAGTTLEDGLTVHRFPVEPFNLELHHAALRAILEGEGRVPAEVESAYLRHGLRSDSLLNELQRRQGEFAAVIVGPYLHALTWEVARTVPEKTFLLPCFHDEALARLPAWVGAYEQVAGILYHTPEEQDFAQAELGLNHPNAVEIGTYIASNGAAGASPSLVSGRYVVYCGRYSSQKGLPRLFDFARRYHEAQPGKFRFAFLGQGEVAIPNEPWALDLGFVSEDEKRAVLAGAAALVQPSRQESLSLVALEAWAEGTPVLADAGCPVLLGQLVRSGGGKTFGGFAEFAELLDDLAAHPDVWKARGQRGRDFVRKRYGSAAAFVERLEKALTGTSVPLVTQMRQRGLERAKGFHYSPWKEAFAQAVEHMLDSPGRLMQAKVDLEPFSDRLTVAAGTGSVLLGVHVFNRGSLPLVTAGPGRTELFWQIGDDPAAGSVPLPRLLLPGRSTTAVLPLAVPDLEGNYDVSLWAGRAATRPQKPEGIVGIKLRVASVTTHEPRPACAPLLDRAQAALVRAHGRHQLPQDYLDVTEGWFARWKRRLKAKLLGNFKKAYVDVISRQQTQVNRELLECVRELKDCCATLDHAVRQLQDRVRELEKEAVATPDKSGHYEQEAEDMGRL